MMLKILKTLGLFIGIMFLLAMGWTATASLFGAPLIVGIILLLFIVCIGISTLGLISLMLDIWKY